MNHAVAYEEVAMEMLRVAGQKRITAAFLADSLDARAMWEYETQHLVMQLWGYVLKEEVQGKWTTHEYTPRSWWDLFKVQALPAWVSRRWPPKYDARPITYHLTYDKTWPHASLRKPLGPPVLKVLAA